MIQQCRHICHHHATTAEEGGPSAARIRLEVRAVEPSGRFHVRLARLRFLRAHVHIPLRGVDLEEARTQLREQSWVDPREVLRLLSATISLPSWEECNPDGSHIVAAYCRVLLDVEYAAEPAVEVVAVVEDGVVGGGIREDGSPASQ